MLAEFAPAKLNLYLHITGRRPDGYHDLDSLAAFAGVGDWLRLEAGKGFSLVIKGPLAVALQNEDPEGNLAVKAARSLAALTGKNLDGIKLILEKNLPVASGIGGGSSDAAAALRLLARYWGLALEDPRLVEAAALHGQDVPVCLKTETNYITTAGTTPGPLLPRGAVVLVNPNKGLATPAVYKEFRSGGYGFSPFAAFTDAPQNLGDLIGRLQARNNDLTDAACTLMPEIRAIIEKIAATPDCLLARMSGSGATCFGIYNNLAHAQTAVARLKEANHSWWVVAADLPF